jgi:hypothetical protein
MLSNANGPRSLPMNADNPTLESTYTTTHHSPIHYISYHTTLPMSHISTMATIHLPKLHKILDSTTPQTQRDDLAFFRYISIPSDMETGELEMEVGVPVHETYTLPSNVEIEEGIRLGVLPEGTYFETRHTGPPSELRGVTSDFLQMAGMMKKEIDMEREEGRSRWVARLEWYEERLEDERWKVRISMKLK